MVLSYRGECLVLDVLDSCGVRKDSVNVDLSGFSFSMDGRMVFFKAHIEDDGYGLFIGEMYRDSLSRQEVDAMHAELGRLKNPITGDISDREQWTRFVRHYDYRYVFEFGAPNQIVPQIVAVAGMKIDDYILEQQNGGFSYSDSQKSMIRGSCNSSIGVFN